METGVLFITLIIVSIVTLPFIAMSRGNRKKQKELYAHLERFAVLQKGHITEYDTFKDFAIGMDSQTNHVYFYKKTPKAEILRDIDLQKMRSCTIDRQEHSTGSGKKVHQILDTVRLVFLPKGGAVTDFLELFNANENFQVSGELELADTWRNKIQRALKA